MGWIIRSWCCLMVIHPGSTASIGPPELRPPMPRSYKKRGTAPRPPRAATTQPRRVSDTDLTVALRGPAVPGVETSLDHQCGQLSVPGADAAAIRGGKSGADGVAGAYRDRGLDPELVAGPAAVEGPAGEDIGETGADTAAKRPGPRVPPRANTTTAPRVGDQAHRSPPMRQGADLAL